MAHEHEPAVTAVGQRGAIDEGQIAVRVFVNRLEGVGGVAAVLEKVDPPRRGAGVVDGGVARDPSDRRDASGRSTERSASLWIRR